MFRRTATVVGVLALIALPAPAAAAAATGGGSAKLGSVENVFLLTGRIPACKFSTAQLKRALDTLDTYGAAYFPDFANAVQDALDTRASGECGEHHAATVIDTGSNAGVNPGPLASATHAPLPAPLVAMLVLAGALALLGGAVTVVRLRGWDPAWAAAARHSWSEAGFRAAGAWGEFVDWLRSRDTGAR
jgi:hypothetical protein